MGTLKVFYKCIDIKEQRYDGRLDVDIKKYWYSDFNQSKNSCNYWKEVVTYYLVHGYTYALELDNVVTVVKGLN
ncbi:hypothetical protein BH18THE1_BH18THE1_10060 [soil metagenome]